MIDPDEPEEPKAPRKPARWKRLLRGVLVFLGILIAFLAVARWQLGRIGQRNLTEITKRLNAEEPGWRLDDLERARSSSAPPPEKNPALVVQSLKDRIPSEWKTFRGYRDWEWGPVSNYQASFNEFAWLVGGQKTTADIRASLHRELLHPEIVACPAGIYPLVHNDNPMQTLLPHIQEARGVIDLLDYDGRLLVMEGKPNQAIGSTRAALVIARSIGEEPFLISQLVRIASARISVHLAMQVLAWSEPNEGLAELQKELLTEADFPWFQCGIKGERGAFNTLFEGLYSGKINFEETMTLMEGRVNNSHETHKVLQSIAFEAYRPLIPGDQAKFLEVMSAYHEVSKLPYHEQKAALAQIKAPPRPPEDFRYLISSFMLPACQKISLATFRLRAELLAGAAAIACERYRLTTGKWPNSLADIPPDILPAIPLDPFNGEPIKYLKLDDGVVIFTAGDEVDQKGTNTSDANSPPLKGYGRGWKLWNKELRRQPKTLPNNEPKAQPMLPVDKP